MLPIDCYNAVNSEEKNIVQHRQPYYCTRTYLHINIQFEGLA